MAELRHDTALHGTRLLRPHEVARDTCSRRFDFGGIPAEFSSDDVRWLAQLGLRYSGFETRSRPTLRVRYDVVPGRKPLPDRPCGELQPIAGSDGTHLELEGPGFKVSADLATGAAVIAGPRHTYPVDAVMRELLPLLTRDSLVMHTALVSDGTRAWACAGPSGAGKTTLAALLGERALCDELAVVTIGRGGIEARSLPYWNARPGRAPLAGIHLLRHGPVHRRTRLAPEAAARRLLAQVAWPTRFPDALARAFAVFGAIAERVPVWELEFAPRADVDAAVFAGECA